MSQFIFLLSKLLTSMPSQDVKPEWTVEWATPSPNDNEYLDNLVLSREQAIAYGDELVSSLQVDGEMLRERGVDPREPFAWRIDDGDLLMEQISHRAFEEVAESDRDDALYARQLLRSRAERRLNRSQ